MAVKQFSWLCRFETILHNFVLQPDQNRMKPELSGHVNFSFEVSFEVSMLPYHHILVTLYETRHDWGHEWYCECLRQKYWCEVRWFWLRTSEYVCEWKIYETNLKWGVTKFWDFSPHFFIDRFHAGRQHLTFPYKRRGILSGKLKSHKLTKKTHSLEFGFSNDWAWNNLCLKNSHHVYYTLRLQYSNFILKSRILFLISICSCLIRGIKNFKNGFQYFVKQIKILQNGNRNQHGKDSSRWKEI